MTAAQLEQTLRALHLHGMDVLVEGRPGQLVATVVSSDFNGQDEEVRQQNVWEHLVKELPDEDRAEVEFVFTLTPEEFQRTAQDGQGPL